MTKVIVYTTDSCPFCYMAKTLLNERQIPFEEIRIDLDEQKRDEMIRLTNRRTVPQIFINDQPIGGYDDLAKLAMSGDLDNLLKSS